MKIILISYSFHPNIGGIETVSRILAEQFKTLGHEIILITRTDCERTYFDFPIIRNPSLLILFKYILWCDVILENNPCLQLSWPALLMCKPTITAIHTWISRPDGSNTLIDKLKKSKLYFSNKVISVSTSIKDEVFNKSIIIGNPFDNALFSNDNPQRNKSKDFVFLGRLVSDKGANLCIEAIRILHGKGNDYTLTIIGNGEERLNLEKLVKQYNLNHLVTFTGMLRESALRDKMSEHKIILIPSLWKEPFGLVALEGMSCGCVPIGSDNSGLVDAIGKAGLIFKRGDVNDLVYKMSKLLTTPNLLQEFNQLAKEHLSNHHPTIIAKKYLQILEQVNN